MSTIRAAHYAETEQALAEDPIVHGLAAGVSKTDRDEIAHPGGTPRHDFMGAANAEYRERGGKIDARHIGAVASAILAVLDEDPQLHCFVSEDGTMRSIAKFPRHEVRPGLQMTTGFDTPWVIVSTEERGNPDGMRTVTVSPK